MRLHLARAALAAVDVIVPLAIALALMPTDLLGITQTCKRAFGLLRWIDCPSRTAAPGQDGFAVGLRDLARDGGRRRLRPQLDYPIIANME